MLGLIRPEWPYFVLGALASIVLALSGTLVSPLVVQPLYDQVIGRGEYGLILGLILKGGALFVLNGLALYVQDALFGVGAARFGARVRREAYAAMLHTNLPDTQASSGGRTARAALDVRDLEGFFSGDLPAITGQGLTMLVAFALLFTQNARLTLGLLGVMLPFVLVLGYLGRRVEAASARTQASAETASAAMSEGLGKLEVIKAFLLERDVLKRFETANQAQMQASSRRARWSALNSPLAQLMVAVGLVVLLWLATGEVQSGGLTAGALSAYLVLLGLLIVPAQILGRAFARLAAVREPARAVRALLVLPPEPDPGRIEKSIHEIRGEIVFEEVSARYEDATQPALEGLNLRIPPGEAVALVGPSGGGKTTITRLLLRLLEPSHGRIVLDGTPLPEYTLKTVRSAVSLVPQQASLFSGSILENLHLVQPTASPEAVWAVLEAASLANEIRAMPHGLDTVIGEQGAGISGGQAQRLAIARALLSDAPIIVLDEPTSALDAHSEAAIRRTLEGLRGQRTVIVIAHRLSTVESMDRIIVLERGRIIEEGPHGQLLQQGGAYAQLLEAARGDA